MPSRMDQLALGLLGCFLLPSAATTTPISPKCNDINGVPAPFSSTYGTRGDSIYADVTFSPAAEDDEKAPNSPLAGIFKSDLLG